MHPTITLGFEASGLIEATIFIGPNPVFGSPGEDLLETCPANFKCFSCLEFKSKDRLGGRTGGEWLCKTCFPHLDLQIVDGIRKFDSRLLTLLTRAAKSGKRPEITKEEWRNIDGQFCNAFTGELIKLSEKKVQEIEDFRKAHRMWRIAQRKGFPGFPHPKDDKLA
jgi:hypothetical protein